MRRPMIGVSFSNGLDVFKTMALLDSGADVSAISSNSTSHGKLMLNTMSVLFDI